MRNGKYGNELKLILLLTENKNYTAQELADKLNITRRNLYNYLEYLSCATCTYTCGSWPLSAPPCGG